MTNNAFPGYLGQPDLWQAQFDKQYGIPTAGRSRYQNWLANQWQVPASEYALSQGFAQEGVGDYELSTDSFSDWLAKRSLSAVDSTVTDPEDATKTLNVARTPWLGNQYFRDLTDMAAVEATDDREAATGAERQRRILESLPNYVGSTAFYSRARDQMPSWLAQSMTGRAFSPEQRRAWDITDAATEGDSFLDFLKKRFGLGT